MSSAELTAWIPGNAKVISQLAHRGLDEPDFYRELLGLLPTSSGVIGSVAWSCAAESFSQLASLANVPEVDLGLSGAEHAAQLHQTRAAKRPQKFRAADAYADAPTIVVLPIVAADEVPVVIAFCLASDLTDESIAEFLRLAGPLCEIAASFYSSASPIANESLGLTPVLHQSLSVEKTCYAVANEGRRAVECDRIAVLTRNGDKFKVRAVSGQESVNKRANVVQYLETLVARVLKTGEPFWYPDQASQLPPQIEQALENYLEVALSRRLAILPLGVEHSSESESEDVGKTPGRGKLLGAVVVEQFTEHDSDESRLRQRSKILVREASVALSNATCHEDIFLLPLWRKLGTLRELFRSGTRWKTASFAGAGLFLIAALAFIPAELKVVADGRLMPSVRHNLFAQVEGTVVELDTAHGASVASGEVLAKLRNHDVDLALQQARGEIRKAQSRIDSIRARRFSHDPSDARAADANAVAAEEENLRVLLKSLKQQLQILKTRQAGLQVVSPIDGQVITWNLDQHLMNRPVERGQMLMEIADLNGPWHLELNLADRRIFEVLEAEEDKSSIEVTYILASNTGQKFTGHVTEIAEGTRVDSENGQHVLVRVGIETDEMSHLQPGTGIQAKIHCGKRSLGYVWLRDIWHFVRSQVLFRIT